MLRVHFSSADLTRIQVAADPDPLWEVLLSSFRSHQRTPSAFLRPWKQWLRTRPTSSLVRPGLRLLRELAPPGPYFPDFVTPREACDGLEVGLEAVMATPRRRLVRELNLLATRGRSSLPPWLGSLVTDSTAALAHVADTVRGYHDAAIAPHLDLIKASVDADRAHRTRHLLDGGVEGMLRGLGPLMDWQPPVLNVHYVVDRDLYLHGRGLRLVPSYFCHGRAIALADPDLTPVLVYPIAAEHRWAGLVTGRADTALRKLLGPTRANVLSAIDHGASTTELARAVDISPASASRHTGVLRDADLITTHRHGSVVLHTLTPLGTRLVNRHQP